MFFIDHPPGDLNRTREQADLILATLALEQAVTVAFVAEGVYHCLIPDRPPDPDASAVFGSLELYDVERIVIEEESLLERDLEGCALRFEPEIVSRRRLRELMNDQDLLL